MKPTVFVASSQEAVEIASEIQLALHPYATVRLWTQDLFLASSVPLDDLLRELDSWDFGIFIFSPDDIVKLRDRTHHAIRDNVLFELGLVMGRLGKLCAFIVRPKGSESARIPSDLIGINPIFYDQSSSPNISSASMGPACTELRKAIQRRFIPKAGLYTDDTFRATISEGWHTYLSNPGSIFFDAGVVQLRGTTDAGFEYPDFEVKAPTRFLLFRIKRISPDFPVVIYTAYKYGTGEVTHLMASTGLREFGWGIPTNEFRIPLANLPVGKWHPVLIDTDALQTVLTAREATISFKFRAPVDISHIWCATELGTIPPNLLLDANSTSVSPITIPADYPQIEILNPRNNAKVNRKHTVEGSIADPKLHVSILVYSPDRNWYLQPEPKMNGRTWSAPCHFGSPESKAGTPFKVIAIAAPERIKWPAPQQSLPTEGLLSEIISVVLDPQLQP